MYTSINFKRKEQLVMAIETGRKVGVWTVRPHIERPPRDGVAHIEGPQWPEFADWYATVRVEDGFIREVLK